MPLSFAVIKNYEGEKPIFGMLPENATVFNHLGFYLSINKTEMFDDKYGVGWGVGFINTGYKQKNKIDNFTRVYRFEYFCFPLSLQMRLGEKRQSSIYVGSSFAWMAQQETLQKSSFNGIDVENSFRQIRSYHRVNQFVFLGGTWAFNIDNKFAGIVDVQFLKSVLDFKKDRLIDPSFCHISIIPSVGLQYSIN